MTIARQTGDVARGSRLRDRLEAADHGVEDRSRAQGPIPSHLLPQAVTPKPKPVAPVPPRARVVEAVEERRREEAEPETFEEPVGWEGLAVESLDDPEDEARRQHQTRLNKERKSRQRARKRGELAPYLPPGRPGPELRPQCPKCGTEGRGRGVRRGKQRFRCPECGFNWQVRVEWREAPSVLIPAAVMPPIRAPFSTSTEEPKQAQEPETAAVAYCAQCSACLATVDRPTLTCPRCGEARMVEMSEHPPNTAKAQELAVLEGLIAEAQERLDALTEEERIATRATRAARQLAAETIRKVNGEIKRAEERLAKDKERLAADRKKAQGAPALRSAYKPAERAAFVAGYYQVFEDLGWNVADLRCRCGKLEREHLGGSLGECSGFRVARRIG